MSLRHVTLHQLRIFQALGQEMSFTRAAARLHLSQPAVSIQVKRLEESVGLPLVEQLGKRLYLTAAGHELLEACNDVLERLKLLGDEMSGLQEGERGTLHLATITTAEYFMPRLLGIYLREHPAVEPRLTVSNRAQVIERLQKNLDDLVIMGTLPDNLDLEAEYFMDNPMVVVAPPDHALVGARSIPLARLAEERFISREAGSGTRAARIRLFEEHGVSARTFMELGSVEAIKQAVMAGLGISVLSLHNLRAELQFGLLAVLDVQHFPLVRKWYAVHLKGKKLSRVAQGFRDFLVRDGGRLCTRDDLYPAAHDAAPATAGLSDAAGSN